MTVDPGPMQSIFVINATSLQYTPGQCNIQNERDKYKNRAPTTKPGSYPHFEKRQPTKRPQKAQKAPKVSARKRQNEPCSCSPSPHRRGGRGERSRSRPATSSVLSQKFLTIRPPIHPVSLRSPRSPTIRRSPALRRLASQATRRSNSGNLFSGLNTSIREL